MAQLTFKMCYHAFVIKYGSVKNIQKGVIGTLASYTDTFYSAETSLKISLKRRDAGSPQPALGTVGIQDFFLQNRWNAHFVSGTV